MKQALGFTLIVLGAIILLFFIMMELNDLFGETCACGITGVILTASGIVLFKTSKKKRQ